MVCVPDIFIKMKMMMISYTGYTQFEASVQDVIIKWCNEINFCVMKYTK